MRCAIFLEKTTRQGDILIADTHGGECGWALPGENGYYGRILTDRKCVGTAADSCFLTAGTYTVTADFPEGKTLTVRAYSYFDGSRRERFPADGSAGVAPLAFTLTADRAMMFDFGLGTDWTDGDISTANTNNVRVHDTNSSAVSATETVAIMPQEIADSDTIAEELCKKKIISLRIPRGIEAFGFAERTVTYVRALDLDLLSDRLIFEGRVTGIHDVMEESGAIAQELTCASALDFFDDTNFFAETESKTLGSWLVDRQAQHNAQVEPARQCFFACDVSALVAMDGDERYCTNREILDEVLTGGKYLYGGGSTITAEYKERWSNGVTYIDVRSQFGKNVDTPFKIGENLRSIRIEQTAEHGIYNAVTVVSGVNSNGKRESRTLYNAELWQKYGPGHTLILQADNICCTAPCEQWNYRASIYEPTEAYLAMVSALLAYARQEANKLSDVPIRIVLSAADLAAMGFTDYERFELGNCHPLVYPPAGYYGQRVRITGLKRRLSDGRVEQIVIESGQIPGGKRSTGSMTSIMARLNALNAAAGESEVKLTEIAQTKAEEQTGGLKCRELTQAEYDAIPSKDSHTVYYADDNGVINLYKGSYHIKTGGGGDEPTIETACVLTTEQMTEWAPDHELLPVEFRGSAGVWYGQPPSRFVIQGQRAIHGVTESSGVTEDDIMSEITFTFRDGTVQKIKVFAYSYSSRSNDITLGVVCYQISGGVQTVIGQSWNVNYYWRLPSGFSAIKAGFSIRVSGFYINGSGQLAPTYAIRMHAFADGAQATPSSSGARQLPNISGMLFPVSTGSNVDFGSAAERGFAAGIAVTSEPVWPNGGE